MGRPITFDSERQRAKRAGVSLYLFRKYLSGRAMSSANARILCVRLRLPMKCFNIRIKRPGPKRGPGYFKNFNAYCKKYNEDFPVVTEAPLVYKAFYETN